jgi:hypothetical protein
VGLGGGGLVSLSAGKGGDRAISTIEGAANATWASVEDVGVDHRRANVVVSKELLDGADVVTLLQEVGGKTNGASCGRWRVWGCERHGRRL